ncbi:hypothetical protein QM065_28885 [Klebsiella pneumoniae]|nr:hypothetical protein [Klebsiella pneumoniae]
MNTSTQKRNTVMIVPPLCIIFWTTALLQSVLRIFSGSGKEVRSGKTPIAPESMGNTDAVFYHGCHPEVT